jgi:hypothetical protein
MHSNERRELIITLVAESNTIEGIKRPPTEAEIQEFYHFLQLPVITIDDLIHFVSVYQPGAILRERIGLDVRIGNHKPPPGGPFMRTYLQRMLSDIFWDEEEPDSSLHAWKTHLEYESLHPFTDGNGRSGRMLWYWMMREHPYFPLGFLHAFYYQTLQHTQLPRVYCRKDHP